ncbi:MAG TPA: regulatory protein RecX [Candidatus Limnocylindrales bacterium]
MTRRATATERRARAEARRAERATVEDPEVVLEAAAAFLAVRPRSVDETRRRLRHLGYPTAPIEVVLDRLLAYGYLDDADFARTWVESRDRARPRGTHALRRELMLKGVDREIIDAALDERGRDASPSEPAADALVPRDAAHADDAAAQQLLARRAGALARESDPRKRRQKAYALLARNGFAPDVCARWSAALTAPSDDDPVLDEDV